MRGVDCLPVRPAEGSRWYSEARLDSPFLRRPGSDSNHLAEGQTHADGVVGHFSFRENTEAGLTLLPGARQLLVLEAKMFSKLSRGITRAPSYDQAARNVACIVWTLHEAAVHPRDLDSIGFFVIAPREQVEHESSFQAWVSSEGVAEKVEARVADYKCDPERHQELREWLDQYFHPLLRNLLVECVPWEDLLSRIESAEPEVHSQLSRFYGRCLQHNGGVEAR